MHLIHLMQQIRKIKMNTMIDMIPIGEAINIRIAQATSASLNIFELF